MIECYLGLGGNVGDTLALFSKALDAIAASEHVQLLETSRFFRTTPVSDIPQDPYLNAACRLKTDLSPFELLEFLQKIEKKLDKIPKAKNAPRPIDLDILFYGNVQLDHPLLQLPHPRWKERLFVLAPLADLIPTVDLQKFNNPHEECVTPLSGVCI